MQKRASGLFLVPHRVQKGPAWEIEEDDDRLGGVEGSLFLLFHSTVARMKSAARQAAISEAMRMTGEEKTDSEDRTERTVPWLNP